MGEGKLRTNMNPLPTARPAIVFRRYENNTYHLVEYLMVLPRPLNLFLINHFLIRDRGSAKTVYATSVYSAKCVSVETRNGRFPPAHLGHLVERQRLLDLPLGGTRARRGAPSAILKNEFLGLGGTLSRVSSI